MQTTDPRKTEIASYVNVAGVSREEIASLLMLPPDTSMGDYALPCFRFAKTLRKAPALIAEELKKDILSLPAIPNAAVVTPLIFPNIFDDFHVYEIVLPYDTF